MIAVYIFLFVVIPLLIIWCIRLRSKTYYPPARLVHENTPSSSGFWEMVGVIFLLLLGPIGWVILILIAINDNTRSRQY